MNDVRQRVAAWSQVEPLPVWIAGCGLGLIRAAFAERGDEMGNACGPRVVRACDDEWAAGVRGRGELASPSRWRCSNPMRVLTDA
ncbi:MAG: hypothetical protein ACYTGR_08625 [Planctomycetota bacterium]|jgi:hypothetical protein